MTRAEAVAAAIRRYLASHPNAADTLDGVLHYWLGADRDVSRSDLKAALDLLTRDSIVSPVALPSGETIYRPFAAGDEARTPAADRPDELIPMAHASDDERTALGSDATAAIERLVARFRRRSCPAALFTGTRGSGKTLAARTLAAEVGQRLYRVDIAAIVSKSIGETEKNLDRIFATAESLGAILLFDEADALFGNRTDVRDAHDRYANIETSYLLERIDAYAGLVVLIADFPDKLDPAFVRRIEQIRLPGPRPEPTAGDESSPRPVQTPATRPEQPTPWWRRALSALGVRAR